MGAEVLVVIAVAVLAGAFVGRWWAETRRARSDMQAVWKARKNYRKRR